MLPCVKYIEQASRSATSLASHDKYWNIDRPAVFYIGSASGRESAMKMIIQAAVVTLAISTQLASAQPVRWETYSIPETGTSVDFPASIFTEQAGRPPDGYGRRFQSADGRADFTIEAAAISSSVSPAAFLAMMHPPPRIQYKRVTSRFFVDPVIRATKSGTTAATSPKVWFSAC